MSKVEKYKLMVDKYIEEKKIEDEQYLEKLGQKLTKANFRYFIESDVMTSYYNHKWYALRYKKGKFLNEASNQILMKEDEIRQVKNFDDLILLIDDIKVSYFKSLTKYDTAIVIGKALGKMPNKVFLHAGPEKACKKLFGKDYDKKVKYLKGRRSLPYIDVEDFPEAFDSLKSVPDLMENCLCYIYSHYKK